MLTASVLRIGLHISVRDDKLSYRLVFPTLFDSEHDDIALMRHLALSLE